MRGTEATTTEKVGRPFYWAGITLLLVAIGAVLIQKQYESGVAKLAASRAGLGRAQTEVHRRSVEALIHKASHWATLSQAAVSLGLLSWGMAIWRRETHRWVLACLIVLVFLYCELALIMV